MWQSGVVAKMTMPTTLMLQSYKVTMLRFYTVRDVRFVRYGIKTQEIASRNLAVSKNSRTFAAS